MLKTTRRITTGIDEAKKSKILADEEVKTLIPYPDLPSFQLQVLFYTEDKIPSLSTRTFDKPYTIELPEGAVRFMKIRMPTKTEMAADLKKSGQPVPEDWTKFNLHSTGSIDYIYVLSGSITCVVGEQTINLNSGDFLAQIGPEHTWINDNNEPCYVLCIMCGIKPSGERIKMTVEL
jgi:mannose-6-phosphate isomerase-like protein (cupin superfamily)